MLAYLESTLTWRDLLTRTYRELMDDDALGLAAQLAYYFFLSLFPAILCVIALASFFPLQTLTDDLLAPLGRFAPDEVLVLLREQMARLAEGDHGGVFSLGLLGAVWSSSAAMVALIDAMNRAYDIQEARPWWKVRLIAVLLTVGLAIFIVLAMVLVVAGPELADLLAGSLGLGAVFTWTWKIVQWPLAFALIASAIALIYYFAPDAEQDFVWITPGSLIATTLWLVGSLAFRIYVVNFGSYEATYGTIAGIVVLMLWFYLSGLVLIIGAEASAEIEHASPWGKAPAEKVPGEKKKLGSAAGRAYRDAGGATTPAPAPAVAAPRPSLPAPSFVDRAAAYGIVFLRWRNRGRR